MILLGFLGRENPRFIPFHAPLHSPLPPYLRTLMPLEEMLMCIFNFVKYF